MWSGAYWSRAYWTRAYWPGGAAAIVGRGRVHRVARKQTAEEPEPAILRGIEIVNDIPRPVKAFKQAKHKFRTDPEITLKTLDAIFHREPEDLSERYRRRKVRRKQKRLLLMLLLDEDL